MAARFDGAGFGKISATRPKAIALDVLYTDPTNEAADKTLAEAIASAGNVIVAAQLTKTSGDSGEAENVWLRPLPASFDNIRR